MKRGKFVVIEGGEGAGKTGVVNYLKEILGSHRDVIFTREPGGTEMGEKIREILMDKKHQKMLPLTEIFLFCASRAQHIEEVIKPALLAGKNVICDRFDGSTLAYQIFGRERKDLFEVFNQLNDIAKNGIEPDAVVYLDVEPEVGLERKQKSGEGRHTRFDAEELEFHTRVRNGYLKQYEESKAGDKSSWRLIPTTRMSETEVKEKVLDIVENLL